MIAQIKGEVAYSAARFLVLKTGGIGYKISVPNTILARAQKGTELSLWTHLAVREEALDLYGFETREELDFFELLVSVSGVGPRSALAILNLAPVEQLVRAIRAGDVRYLTKVSGVGSKSAAKIVIELKDKLGTALAGDIADLREEAEALLALKALGYGTNEARGALQAAGDAHANTGEKIKAALKFLSRQ